MLVLTIVGSLLSGLAQPAAAAPRASQAPVQITIDAARVVEGTGGTTTARFTVRLSRASSSVVRMSFATRNWTAVANSDFRPVSGTLTFQPGQRAHAVSVPVVTDSVVEANEEFLLVLTNASGATLTWPGPGLSVGTILNDDTGPQVRITPSVAAAEGGAGTNDVAVTLSLSQIPTRAVSVNYATADGSATAGSDYVGADGIVTFAPGQTSKQVTIGVLGDYTPEPDETFTVNFTAPLNSSIVGNGVTTVTITNDDAAPTLSITGPAPVTEGSTGSSNLIFSVALSAPSASTVTVDYETVDGTAVGGVDYTVASGTLAFLPGQVSKLITVSALGDRTVETDETFFVSLTSASGAAVSGTGLATGTILNDDAVPALSITAPAASNEGSSGTQNFVFSVVLSSPSSDTVTVEYASEDGSATAGSDYTAVSGTLTFLPGQTSKQINVPVVGDLEVEVSETFSVSLTNPINALVTGTGSALATITNDDSLPTIAITAPAATVEGSSGTTNFVFTVSLSAPSTSTVTVDYQTIDGAAVGGVDFVAAGGTLTFLPGQVSKQVIVAVNGDTSVEPDEVFFVSLTGASGATVSGTGLATGTITNDDALPTLTITAPAATAEGNAGTQGFAFTVAMSAPSANTVTVGYSTIDGSANAGSDYVALSGTLTFAPGQTSQQVSVLVNGDLTVEISETFSVNLSSASNATISGTGAATATITNDDVLPTLTIAAPAAASEGNTLTTNFTFTVSLSAPVTNTVTVAYTTVDGSATAGSDFISSAGTLTYLPGQISQQVIVQVVGDLAVEAAETFSMYLTNPVNATLAGTGIATATINNDDSLPTITVTAPAATNEGNSGTTNFPFTVALSAPSASAVTVDFATVNGSAVAGSDFIATAGTLTFAPGQTAQIIIVQVSGDLVVEATETFALNLTNPSGALVGGNGIATASATITNDDTLPTLTVTAPAATAEGNAGTQVFGFTVALSGPSPSTVTVSYSTIDGSATAGSDYVALSGTLTFLPGQVSQIISVPVNGDLVVELTETFSMNLSSPTNATISGTGSALATITNDDTVPTLTLAAPTAANEGAANTSALFNFTVTLSAPQSTTVTVDFTTVDGTTTAGSDYQATSGTLTFLPGQVSKAIPVAVFGDALYELPEVFSVLLSNPTNATIVGTGSGTTTINNDDTMPALSIANVTQAEGSGGGTTNMVFTVTLSAASGVATTVNFATLDGTALAGADYEATSGLVTIAAGQTTATITVAIVADAVAEPSETFTVRLSGPGMASISTATATGTITNDD